MEDISTADLVLVTLLTEESWSETDRSVPLDAVTAALTSGEQLSEQVEVAVAVTTLTEQGVLDRETVAGEERLTLTDSARERARSTRNRIADTAVDLVEDGTQQTKTIGDLAAELDRSLVGVATACTDDGCYYLHDGVTSDPLVGRDWERMHCRDVLAEALDSRQGQILVLSGPSGVGKTTLLESALGQVSEAVDVVSVYCRDVGSEPHQVVRAALASLDAENPFTTVEFDVSDPETYEAQQTALFHEVTDLLTPEEGIRVLFLDDIDDIDAASWAYLDFLCDQIGDRPLVLVATHRPGTLPEDAELSPGIESESPSTRLPLTGLDRDQTRVLLGQLLNRRDVPADFVDAIHERTEGNPLSIETTIDTLIESNQLDPQLQWYPDDVDAIDLPDAIQETIRQRLEGLDEEARTVLEWAAVAGEPLPVETLGRLAGPSSDHIDPLVETLVDATILSEQQRGDQRWVTIRNNVVREALRGTLDDEATATRHAAIAAELETLARPAQSEQYSQSGEQASTIAHHYEQAGEHEAAIEWYERAAREARAVYAHETARDHYHSVLDIARTTGVDEVLRSTGQELAELLVTTNDYDEAERYVQFVRERTSESDAARRRETARIAATIATKRGAFSAAIETASGALALSEGHDTLHCRLLSIQAEAEWRASDYEAAEETCKRCFDLACELGQPALEAEAAHLLGRIQRERSDLDAAREYYEYALDKARAVGDHHHVAEIQNGLGLVVMNAGDTDTAREYYEQALDTFENVGDRHQAAKTYNNLAILANREGNVEQAETAYRRALETAETVGDLELAGKVRLNLGAIAGQRSAFEKSREYFEAACETFEEIGDDHYAAVAMLSLGDVLSRLGEFDTARTQYEGALSVVQEVGDDFRASSAHRGLAEVALNRGAYDEAEAHLDAASECIDASENPVRRAGIRTDRALLAYYRQNYERARQLATDALPVFSEDGSETQVANAKQIQGMVARDCDDTEDAREHFEDARERYTSVSAQRAVAIVDRERGILEREVGNHERARDRLASSLETLDNLDAVYEAALTRHELGRLAVASDDLERARKQFETALATFDACGARADVLDTLEALVTNFGAETPSVAQEWCDRGCDLATASDAPGLSARSEWFQQQRQQLDG